MQVIPIKSRSQINLSHLFRNHGVKSMLFLNVRYLFSDLLLKWSKKNGFFYLSSYFGMDISTSVNLINEFYLLG